MSAPAIPAAADAIDAAWLDAALKAGGHLDGNAVATASATDIGTGVGLMGALRRFEIGYEHEDAALPRSVVVKLPSPSPENFAIGKALHLYAREYGFYRHLATQAPVRSPALLYGDFDEESHRFVLVLEDLSGMTTPDQIDGANAEQARLAVREIAKLHGGFWGQVDEGPMAAFFDLAHPEYCGAVQMGYSAYLSPTLANFGDCFTPELSALAESYAPKLAQHLAGVSGQHRTFIHGDFRLDNMFFGAPGEDSFVAIDWQISGRGAGLYDIAYFLSASVSTEVRRQVEEAALAEYCDIVCAMGAQGFDLEECRRQYREAMLACFIVPVYVCGALDLGNERGRQLAEVGLRRALTAINDLGAKEFLPA
jgi:hypothetical protein